MNGEERLRRDLDEIAADGQLASNVVASLAAYKEAGEPFETAWYRAMRDIVPWDAMHTDYQESISAELRESITEDRELIYEVKPHLRSAYEGRETGADEVDKATIRAERRLDRLTLSGPRHRRARAQEPPLT